LKFQKSGCGEEKSLKGFDGKKLQNPKNGMTRQKKKKKPNKEMFEKKWFDRVRGRGMGVPREKTVLGTALGRRKMPFQFVKGFVQQRSRRKASRSAPQLICLRA